MDPPVRPVRLHGNQPGDVLPAAAALPTVLLGEEEAAVGAEGGRHDLPAGHQRPARVERAKRLGDDGGGSPRGRDADQVVAEVLGPGAAPRGRAGAAGHHDRAAVRGPGRVDVLRGDVGETRGSAAGPRDRQEVPLGVVPGGVGDGGAVRRERGRQLVGGIVTLDQPLGRAVRKRHAVEPAGGMEDRHRAVRGNRGPADHPGPEGLTGDVELRPGLLGDPAPDLGHEGHFLGGAARRVHLDDPAAPQHVDGRAVRCPGVPGEHTLGLHPLGEVGLDGIREQPFGAGVEIAQEERGAGAETVALEGDRAAGDPAREGEPASVGGRLGRDRAAARPLVLLLGLPLGHVVDLSGLEVEFPNLHGAPDQVAF